MEIYCRTANQIPKQKTQTDCGIFICQYAECITLDMEIMDFEQDCINDIRDQMKLELAFNELDEKKHIDRQKI